MRYHHHLHHEGVDAIVLIQLHRTHIVHARCTTCRAASHYLIALLRELRNSQHGVLSELKYKLANKM